MLAAARVAWNGNRHVGKGCKNHDVSAQPGRNRLTRSRATSEDSRHEAAFYSAMPWRSRAKHGPAHVEHVKSSSGRFAYSFRLDVKTEGVQSSQVGHGTTASAEQVAVDDRVVVTDLARTTIYTTLCYGQTQDLLATTMISRNGQRRFGMVFANDPDDKHTLPSADNGYGFDDANDYINRLMYENR